MPIVQISWAKIKERYDDETALVALTTRHISLLSTLAEQLKWDKTFRTDDLDPDDTEEIQTEVDDLISNLTMPVILSDLIGYIDEIEELLRALNSTANCCSPVDVTDGDQYTDPVTDGSGDVPQNIIDAGYATGTSDWDGFYDYKCMISHVMVTDMENSLRAIHERFDDVGVIIGGVGTVAAIIGSIVAGIATGGVTLLLEAIAALGAASAVWGGLTELGDVAVESLADKVAQYHDGLACAIYNADGTYDAVDELQAAIDTFFTSTEALILKNMNLGPKLKGLYAGRYDQQDIAQNMADNGYDPTDYDCTCEDDFFDVPTNYVVQRAVLGTCTSGSPYCNGVSASGHIITLSGYTQTAGFRVSLTGPGTVVGYIVEMDVDNGTWTAADNDCNNHAIKFGDTGYKESGLTIGLSTQGHMDNWATWVSTHGAEDYVGDACLSGLTNIQCKNNAGGTVNGTIKVWHILSV